jgi:hypothetical protein
MSELNKRQSKAYIDMDIWSQSAVFEARQLIKNASEHKPFSNECNGDNVSSSSRELGAGFTRGTYLRTACMARPPPPHLSEIWRVPHRPDTDGDRATDRARNRDTERDMDVGMDGGIGGGTDTDRDSETDRGTWT